MGCYYREYRYKGDKIKAYEQFREQEEANSSPKEAKASRCSFCHNIPSQSRLMIAGPVDNLFICEDCVRVLIEEGVNRWVVLPVRKTGKKETKS
ncbi:MAG: ClpX C4-type zinc finger protein [Tannerellaceae bacterium]|nr:ClpX C4-type zinc finger protein [Tannerellaceae bacterium]